jgi:hypothetical protein
MRKQRKPSKPALSERRQIAPPPLSQHLREFASNPDAWAVLARNLVPVVGIYALGWSAALAVFNYWFDGVTALAAIITVLVPRAMRETRQKSDDPGLLKRAFAAGLTWVVLIGVVGLPYWIVLIPLHDLLLGGELRQALASSPGLWCAFGSLAAGHVWKALRAGYDTLPDRELTQRVRWDVYLLILRAVAMFMMATNGFVLFMVPLMALLLTYFELWPERILGAVFGDPAKLYEYDPQKDRR